jgi:glycosyltransferase involved in cell wall biosynthesis
MCIWPVPGRRKLRLRALAAELGITARVSFLGWRRDIGALLAAADIFICSSRHEPLGNIVLEAWSAARAGDCRRRAGAERN